MKERCGYFGVVDDNHNEVRDYMKMMVHDDEPMAGALRGFHDIPMAMVQQHCQNKLGDCFAQLNIMRCDDEYHVPLTKTVAMRGGMEIHVRARQQEVSSTLKGGRKWERDPSRAGNKNVLS
jgi:hypothetical protein